MISDINISKLVVPDKLPFDELDFKCFVGYKDAKKIRYLWIFCPKMNIYIYIYIYKRYFNKTKWMHSFIKDNFFSGI